MYLVCFTTGTTIFLAYDYVFYYVTHKLLIIIDVKHYTTIVNHLVKGLPKPGLQESSDGS